MSETPRGTISPPDLDAWLAFTVAANRVKAADAEHRAAQQVYVDAVKRLSEEATK